MCRVGCTVALCGLCWMCRVGCTVALCGLCWMCRVGCTVALCGLCWMCRVGCTVALCGLCWMCRVGCTVALYLLRAGHERLPALGHDLCRTRAARGGGWFPRRLLQLFTACSGLAARDTAAGQPVGLPERLQTPEQSNSTTYLLSRHTCSSMIKRTLLRRMACWHRSGRTLCLARCYGSFHWCAWLPRQVWNQFSQMVCNRKVSFVEDFAHHSSDICTIYPSTIASSCESMLRKIL